MSDVPSTSAEAETNLEPPSRAVRALLLSNSTNAGLGNLEHARDALSVFLHGVDTVVFVPLHGRDP